MNRSIGTRITAYMMLFALLIISIIGIAVRFILPSYYFQYQMDRIETVKAEVYAEYDVDDPLKVYPLLEQLKDAVGGELYYYSVQQGQPRGAGKGRNAVIENNGERFIPDGAITDYTYTNKIGLEIFVLGVAVEGEYLVYEVSIQSINNAVGVIIQFFWILLIVTLILAMIMSVLLSTNITKPIKALNKLAKSMKDKKIEAVMVTSHEDEIGQLNHSLNALYEELLNNISYLETELKKERNAEKLKKRFLAQATHELKTPISVIRGYAEILYDGIYKSEEDRDRYLKNIYEETEAISHLIIDVLDYTKMETGNYKLEKVRINALDFYGDLARRYKDYIEANGLTARLDIQIPKDQTVEIDKNRVEQVMRNLVANAVEHSQTTVGISAEVSGSRIKLSIFNDGENIDEEDLPYIFDSFYKKKGKQRGTGLGLAIVKEIVLLHGGDYRAVNLEKGVKFIVSL